MIMPAHPRRASRMWSNVLGVCLLGGCQSGARPNQVGPLSSGIPGELRRYEEICLGPNDPHCQTLTGGPAAGPLSYTVSLDQALAFDGSKMLSPVVFDVVPTVVIRFAAGAQSIPDPSVIKLKFSKRRDGVDPTFESSAFHAGKTTGEFDYQIPFKEKTVLYAGDQYVEIEIADALGNPNKQTIPFTIGAHDIAPNNPIPKNYLLPNAVQEPGGAEEDLDESTRHVLRLPTSTRFPPQEVPLREQPLKSPFKTMPRIRVPAAFFFGDTLRAGAQKAPRYFVDLIEVSTIDTAATVVGIGATAVFIAFLGDEAAVSVQDYFTKVLNKLIFRYTIPEIGPLELTEDDWNLMQGVHTEIDRTLITDAVVALKERSTQDFELWGLDSRYITPEDAKPGSKFLLIFKRYNLIFKFLIRSREAIGPGSLIFKFQMGSGIFDIHNGIQTLDLAYQWSDIINYVGECRNDGNPQWNMKYGNVRPTYGQHLIGQISDDLKKTYDCPQIGGTALALRYRDIVETFPLTTDLLRTRAEEKSRRNTGTPLGPDGMSRAGAAFSKHASNSRAGPNNPFPPALGNNRSKSDQGAKIYQEIIENEKSVLIRVALKGLNFKYKIFSPDGRGATFMDDGYLKDFRGALEEKPLPLIF
jgi:hypothetical protein